MKFLSLLLLVVLNGCATSQYVYECVSKRYAPYPKNVEFLHEVVTAKTLDSAVKFYSSNGNQDFYCSHLTWTKDTD